MQTTHESLGLDCIIWLHKLKGVITYGNTDVMTRVA